MFGEETSYYKLGKYVAGVGPVDVNSDWTHNFEIIDTVMGQNKQANTTIATGVSEIETQSQLLSSQIADAKTEMVKINADTLEISLQTSQAKTLSENALTISTSAKTEANTALQSANTAKTNAGLAVSQNTTNSQNIESLTQRIQALENEE